MTRHTVTELPQALQPVIRDPFIDDLDAQVPPAGWYTAGR
jgi:hypothetical protein